MIHSNYIHKTRFPELGYAHVAEEWRFVAMADRAVIGPYYLTEKELLADLDRYAEFYGCAPRRKDRLNIVVYHGEARTLFYVVVSSESDVDWSVVKTFHSREEAREFIAAHKAAWPTDFE